MKKILIITLILLFVATVVFSVDVLNTRSLKKAVQPYVEQWGECNRYIIDDDDVGGLVVVFAWWDEWGRVMRWVTFQYVDDQWEMLEASEELVKAPANVY